MSEGFHKGNNIFSFSDEFERQQHISQQQSRSRSDKLRSLQQQQQQQQHALLFDASAAVEAAGHDPNLVAMQEEEEEGGVYGGGSAGTSNMLSDMFNINYPAPAFGLHFITDQHQQDPAASTTTTSTAAVSYLDQQMRPVDSFYVTRPDQLVHIINDTTPSTASNWSSVLGEDSAASGQADHRFFLLNNSNNNNNNNTSGRNIEEDDHHQLHHSSSSDVHHMQAQQTSFLHQQVACQQGHMMGYGPVATLSIFRNSLYARAAQELLEEFCSVSRGHFFKGATRTHSSMMNPSSNIRGGVAAASSSSSKEITPLSTADRFESQRKKSKLVSMLEEVERRYNQYREQMQMVVNSFESVMGFGAATPYTALAQKAMSRHFRCLKDAIEGQLRRICELLGDKEGTGVNNIGSGGLTRVETPKLRLIDQSLRQQRAFHHQLGMMDHDQAWRPQRGLPDRSVTILRAWLFDHFLHPYPSDADKHLLARQTGLSRNQVSNWFINARVRLWKPMVEDMYQKEAKEAEDSQQQHMNNDQEETNNQSIIMAAATTSQQMSPRAHHINPTLLLHNTPDSASQADCVNPMPRQNLRSLTAPISIHPQPQPPENDIMYRRPAAMSGSSAAASSQQTRTGDLSLTLGLRHAGVNPAAPETGRFGLN